MNKASGGDGIPVELFPVLKDDAVKVLHSTCQQIWKIQQATSLEKLVFIPIAQRVKRLPAVQETWVRSLGQEDPLEKEMATHSSTLA